VGGTVLFETPLEAGALAEGTVTVAVTVEQAEEDEDEYTKVGPPVE